MEIYAKKYQELRQYFEDASDKVLRENLFASIKSLESKNNNRIFFETLIEKKASPYIYQEAETISYKSDQKFTTVSGIVTNEFTISDLTSTTRFKAEKHYANQNIEALFDAFIMIAESNLQVLAPLIDEICFGENSEKDTRYVNLFYASRGKQSIKEKLQKAELVNLSNALNNLTNKTWYKNLNYLRKNTAHVQNLEIEFINTRGYHEMKIVLAKGKKENLQKFCREISKNIDDFIKEFLLVLTNEIKIAKIPLFINIKEGDKK